MGNILFAELSFQIIGAAMQFLKSSQLTIQK